MKITGPSKTSATAQKGKAKGASAADGSFGDMVASAAASTPAAAAPQNVSAVGALLAVQNVESATERAAKRRMVSRADDILDALDQMRLSLLGGNLTMSQLINIADRVAHQRESVSDPQMNALLDDIDLRAQVEIAKMRQGI